MNTGSFNAARAVLKWSKFTSNPINCCLISATRPSTTIDSLLHHVAGPCSPISAMGIRERPAQSPEKSGPAHSTSTVEKRVEAQTQWATNVTARVSLSVHCWVGRNDLFRGWWRSDYCVARSFRKSWAGRLEGSKCFVAFAYQRRKAWR